ncbi:MAG: DNA pilot protein [Malazfec virus 6]
MDLGGAAAGDILGPVINYLGNERTNQQNDTSAKDSMRFTDKQTRQQMQFQERMSNTAVQRSMADHKKAGLNPLLALQNQASSPNGAAGSGDQASFENSLGAAVGSAMEMASLKLAQTKNRSEIKNIDAATRKADMETKVLSKGIPEAEIKNEVFDMLRPWINKLKGAQKSSAKHFPEEKGSYNPEKNAPKKHIQHGDAVKIFNKR